MPSLALTFDDGPSQPWTNRVLDVLKSYRVRATFFLVGQNVEALPHVVGRMVEEGHALGNHSFHHWPVLSAISPFYLVQEIARTEEALRRAADGTTRLFRPPFGHRSPWTEWVLRRLGYRLTLWDISSGDWRRTSPEAIAKRVFPALHPGAIILMHDGNGRESTPHREATVLALPEVIEGCQQRGYTFITLPELIEQTEASSGNSNA